MNETKFIRIFRSESGQWWIEIEREGIIKRSSLRTNNEQVANRKAAQWGSMIARTAMTTSPPAVPLFDGEERDGKEIVSLRAELEAAQVEIARAYAKLEAAQESAQIEEADHYADMFHKMEETAKSAWRAGAETMRERAGRLVETHIEGMHNGERVLSLKSAIAMKSLNGHTYAAAIRALPADTDASEDVDDD